MKKSFCLLLGFMFTTPITLPLAVLWWGFDTWREYLEIQWEKVLREKK